MIGQIVFVTDLAKLPEVSDLWWLHPKDEQSMVLPIL
jgi:hypothetical protein